MNWNQDKSNEKQIVSGLNQQQGKIGSERSDMVQETNKEIRSKADIQLSSLTNTLKDMIKTDRDAGRPFQIGLAGFYKEISRFIKR